GPSGVSLVPAIAGPLRLDPRPCRLARVRIRVDPPRAHGEAPAPDLDLRIRMRDEIRRPSRMPITREGRASDDRAAASIRRVHELAPAQLAAARPGRSEPQRGH